MPCYKDSEKAGRVEGARTIQFQLNSELADLQGKVCVSRISLKRAGWKSALRFQLGVAESSRGGRVADPPLRLALEIFDAKLGVGLFP